MKSFWKYVLATVVGMIIVSVIFLFTTVSTIIGLAGAQSTKTSVEKNSVLVISLNGSLEERTEDNPLTALLSGSIAESQSLANILKAIDHAKTDDNIKGIYIEAGTLIGAAPATLQEIRRALADFKKSEKFIISYSDMYTQGAYYLCSVSDTLIVNPQGIIDWHGLSMQTRFYKDLLDKIGVRMQVFKVGTYKSAVEPFLLNEMSPANREQLTLVSSELWQTITKDVSKSRGISVERLNQLADSFMAFTQPDNYIKEKLADCMAYSDAVPQTICNMMGVDSKEDYHTISVSELASISSSKPKGTSGNVIALYYAFGDIVQESSQSIPGYNSEHEIVGKTTVKELQELCDNDDVKAVVIRVNSGGGSAYASEQIWHAIRQLKAKKPVIVSMGDYAASGGYYISCAADWIVAQPTTITGSIGIFGLFPEADELMNKKIGIHVSTVKTNAHSDLGQTMARAFTADEAAIVQKYVDNGYTLFTERCATSRNKPVNDILQVAEGRIWTGQHALKLGLVDQLGSINDAINVAKKRAGIDEYSIKEYPAETSFLDNLLNDSKGGSYADASLKVTLGEYYEMFSQMRSLTNHTGIQAKLPYSISFNF